MKRKWWLVPVVLAALIGVLWIFASDQARLEPLRAAIGLKPVSVEHAKSKPICSQVIVPAGDCIPQHMANLPPDPGPAGMLTIEGVDSNKNGVRDDVEIRIVQKWGSSERAVQALFLVAKHTQNKVKYGGDVDKEGEEISRHKQNSEAVVRCYLNSVPEEIRLDRAMDRVTAMVRNTPERFERYRAFESLLHMQLYPSTDMSVQDACGYDPALLNN